MYQQILPYRCLLALGLRLGAWCIIDFVFRCLQDFVLSFFIVMNIKLIRKEMASMAELGGGQQWPVPCYYHTAPYFFATLIMWHSPCQSGWFCLVAYLVAMYSTMCWATEAPFLIPLTICYFTCFPDPTKASLIKLLPSQGSFYPLVRWCFLSSTLLGYCHTQSVI